MCLQQSYGLHRESLGCRVPLEPSRQGNGINSSNVFVTVMVVKRSMFYRRDETFRINCHQGIQVDCAVQRCPLSSEQSSKTCRSTICGAVFCVRNMLRDYLCVCRSLHWAMLNAGEVVILWELQVHKFQSRFRNFILFLCEKQTAKTTLRW